MNKNKLGSSSNKQEEILNFLKSDLPEIFSEGKIDCKKLKQTLGEEVDDSNERYGLSWAGKSNCFRVIQEQTTATLKLAKDESVNFDQTQNLFIEGDNLEVLKVLQRSYYGKVKMIYIDPPYNTGNDFIYNDKFQQNREEYLEAIGDNDGNGNAVRADGLSRNTKDSGHYHSNWLNMMYPRLFLARNLLKQDGVIFVSIDDREAHNLRLVLNEIFGEDNFIADIAVVNNLKGRNDKKYIATAHERLLMYVKSYEFEEGGLDLPEERITEFNTEDSIGKYRLLGLRKRGGADTREERPKMFFPIYVNKEDGNISLEKNGVFTEEVLPRKSDNTDGCWRWGFDTVKRRTESLTARKVGKSERYDVFEKDYLETNGEIRKLKPKSVMLGSNYSTDGATKAFRSLFPEVDFNNPKPVSFIKDLLFYSTLKDNQDIVLDFFSGSGTTAHAVMQQNADDGGNRKFICIQLPELCDEESEAYKAGYKTIAEIGKERIQRAGKKIEKESKHKVDLGFRVLKLDKSNFKVWQGKFENTEKLLDAMAEFVDNVQKGSKEENILFELILKSGLDLNVPVEEREFGGEKYYSLDGGKLIVYLGKKITKELSEEIQKAKPEKFICLDGCFQNNDQLKTNISLQMEQEKIDFKVI
jgi:adenine-specific DNA-methyltransferase